MATRGAVGGMEGLPWQLDGTAALFVCPACRSGLTWDDETLRCSSCRRPFPILGAIPVLFEDAEAVLRGWSGELAEFVAASEALGVKLGEQLEHRSLVPLTRARIECVRRGLIQRGRRTKDIFAAVGLEPGPTASAGPLQTRGRIAAYYHQIHRDWAWDREGSTENATSLNLVLPLLDPGDSRSQLVLGAGACRLAYDLHRQRGFARTVALDINPLPLFVAHQVLAGRTVRLPELPATPRTSAHEAVDRELRCKHPGAAGFHLVLGDGLRPPLREQAFDVVLTPWFIDQVPKDPLDLLPMLRSLLKEGGAWVNHGPLLYHPGRTALEHRYRADEFLELLPDHGFAVEASQWDRLLYMQSPAGAQGRTEGVLTFRARAT